MQSEWGCQSIRLGQIDRPMKKGTPHLPVGSVAPRLSVCRAHARSIAAITVLASISTLPLQARPTTPEAEIRSVIADMAAAWNRGDFEGYMQGFQNPGVVFVSRGQFQDDWQGTLDHYVRDYGGAPERRGTLHFYDIKVEILSDDAAQLISRYHLDRAESPQYGINTRLMRRVGGRWVIALNHVSSAETPDPNDPVEAHRR